MSLCSERVALLHDDGDGNTMTSCRTARDVRASKI